MVFDIKREPLSASDTLHMPRQGCKTVTDADAEGARMSKKGESGGKRIKRFTYIGSHPGEELAAEHVNQAGGGRSSEGGEVDHHDDTARLAVVGALLVAEAGDGVGADHAAVGVDDEDDLLAGVGEGGEAAAEDGGILVEADGGGLGADGGEGDGLRLVALEGQAGADEVKGLRTVPGTRCEDDGGQLCTGQDGRGDRKGRGEEAGDLGEHLFCVSLVGDRVLLSRAGITQTNNCRSMLERGGIN